jgi:hypothetical protein
MLVGINTTFAPMNEDYPRWLRVLIAIGKNWKETFGSVAILATLYLWYFDQITQEKAVFGLILLVAGGFINNTFDFIGLFKYIGNYKKGGNDATNE